jgi:hypothetical protein
MRKAEVFGTLNLELQTSLRAFPARLGQARFVWSLWFIWLVLFNQTNETNQMNQITIFHRSL